MSRLKSNPMQKLRNTKEQLFLDNLNLNSPAKTCDVRRSLAEPVKGS